MWVAVHCWVVPCCAKRSCAAPPLQASPGCMILAQVCGGYPDVMAHTAQLLEENISADFVDVNMGCPIDLICNKRAPQLQLLDVILLLHHGNCKKRVTKLSVCVHP